MQLEIAVQDVPGAELAVRHGADRVELCCALQLGGLTPSQGLLTSVRRAQPELPIHVLIRPRPGDYVYDSAAVALMVQEIKELHDGGATGVVIGALTADGAVDYATVETLIEAAGDLHVTFHRAIDHLPLEEAAMAIPQLVDVGVQRVLSSGGAVRAGAGLRQLAALHAAAAGALTVMAGGGVTLQDFAAFHEIGLRDVHLSAKRTVNRRPPSLLTPAAASDDPSYYATDGAVVGQAAEAAAILKS